MTSAFVAGDKIARKRYESAISPWDDRNDDVTRKEPTVQLELQTLWKQLAAVGGAEMVITKAGR